MAVFEPFHVSLTNQNMLKYIYNEINMFFGGLKIQ